MTRHTARISLAVVLTVALLAGLVVASRSWWHSVTRTHLVAYFDNSNGIFAGDDVRIMGVTVGKVDKIEPQPLRAKISFWIDDSYRAPADAKAVILSPGFITARAIQLLPAYTAGPALADGAVIPQSRTAVPMEWDDLRAQLKKFTDYLQPTQPDGVSTLGALINTGAENLRGNGADIRDTVIKLSTALSTLGDHSTDIFSTVKHVAALVSALQSSTDLMQQLNRNLAGVTSLLTNNPNEIANAVANLNTAVSDVRGFVADNKEVLGTASERLQALSQTLVESLDDIKQALHVLPNVASNFYNIYNPAQGGNAGIFALNQFANPIQVICGAIEATSRLRSDVSSKLCVQYLAPIIKNRQYNFPPLGENLFVGATARPNEISYSEDRLRPDYIPGRPPAAAAPPPQAAAPPAAGPQQSPPAAAGLQDSPQPAAESRVATDPRAGLTGIMVPPGGGS